MGRNGPKSRDGLRPPAFPTTRWSRIYEAGQGGTDARALALAELLKEYRPALCDYLTCSNRVQPDQVEDVVHSFILDRFILNDLLQKADRTRGRFRSYLLESLNNFVANQKRHDRTLVRSPGYKISSLDASTVAVPGATDEDIFDLAWTTQIISETIARMAEECRDAGHNDVWEIFVGRILNPILWNQPATPYGDLVRRCDFKGPSQAHNALVTAKRRFDHTLRWVVAQYVRDEAELNTEIEELTNRMSRCAGTQ